MTSHEVLPIETAPAWFQRALAVPFADGEVTLLADWDHSDPHRVAHKR